MKLPTDEEIDAMIERDPLLGGLKASEVFGPLKAIPLSEQCCGNCRFYEQHASPICEGGGRHLFDGVCRRYPPKSIEKYPYTEIVELNKSYWCGEWQEKEK